MSSFFRVGLLTICTLAAFNVSAAEFSDNSIGVSYGTKYSNPGTNDGNVKRFIYNFSHFSVDKLGTNLVIADILKSNNKEPAAGGEGGAQEFYGFYQRNWSMNKILGKPLFEIPFVRDISLTTRFDFGTKNDDFGGRPRKIVLGSTFSFDVPKGFFDAGIYAHKESNHNGIVGKDVSFSTAARLGLAWDIPVVSGVSFNGFMDVIAPKGKDGFGNETKTETLIQAKLMADTGELINSKKNGFEIGVGLEYWRNKFGADPAKAPAGTTKQSTPFLLARYHF